MKLCPCQAGSNRKAVPLQVQFDPLRACNYSYYMKPRELKVARIGNSRGVRLPAVTLERYRIGESVIMEERTDGILLRPIGSGKTRLSWEDTAREMASSSEDWSDWEGTAPDGLDEVPWRPGTTHRVAET